MNDFNIIDYGARRGEVCTREIQSAFDAASAAGGKVVVPRGEFLTGTIDMGGASLYLEKGAVLKGSGNWADYREVGYSHNEMGQVKSLLYTIAHEDVTVYGFGTIDLNGRAFYEADRPNVPEDQAARMTEAQRAECTLHYEHRPNQPIFFLNCRRVTVRDVHIVDAPCWTLSFVSCADVRVTDVTIDNGLNIPNCDGMHFCCSHDILVRGCRITAGDDCIAFTGITDWNTPCERAVVSDCVFQSASKAISIGYMHSIVRDITVTNCVVTRSNRALVLMVSEGTGLIEEITLSNLRLDSRVYAGNWWGHGEPICLMCVPHDSFNYRDKAPERRFPVSARRILLQNVNCSGENVIACVGVPGSVTDIHMDHVLYRRKDSENLLLRGHMVDLAPGAQTAILADDEHAWLYLRGIRNSSISRCFTEPWNDKKLEHIVLDCEAVTID